VVVLLTESASLTSRETLTVLGRSGIAVDVVSSGRFTISQFSRWRRRSVVLPPPADDPGAFVRAIGRLTVDGGYQALLPTHEQAWLLAAGRRLLPRRMPVALADPEAFDQVQSKLAFARLLDRLTLPQPRWWLPGRTPDDALGPWWVKAAFGTAGRSVRAVGSAAAEAAAAQHLGTGGREVMCQENAPGQYGQVHALFDHGRLVAVHCSVKVGDGLGGSAAARLSVDHPQAREAVEALGRHLAWHGGLALDYLHVDGSPLFIEGNPRLVEPGNAAAAGVDLPALTIALSAGESLSGRCVVGRPGVRTHSTLALALGATTASDARRGVLRALASHGGPLASSEVLTPLREDRRAVVPLAITCAQALIAPAHADRLARSAVEAYAITPAMVDALR
jgi:hypothetical protein